MQNERENIGNSVAREAQNPLRSQDVQHPPQAQDSPHPPQTQDSPRPQDAQQAQDSQRTSHAQHQQRSPRARKRPNAIKRLFDHWFNRLLGVYNDRSFQNQEEQYAANRTKRDFAFNTIGSVIFGIVFPVLTVVATHVSGVEKAGMFSMAFVVSQLLFIVANFGVRTYQISDLQEKHSFKDYQLNRIITCVLMIILGIVYCKVRSYDAQMFNICLGIFIYKAIDGLADVYEGRLQQMEKMYLAGISLGVRSLLCFVIFGLILFITRSLVIAGYFMALAALASFIFVTLPLAYLETPKSSQLSFSSVFSLFVQCWPLFAALFLYQLIDNMPKFVMEAFLSYDNQLYLNVLYFLSHIILQAAQTIYKPLLVKMARLWADPQKRKRFDIVIVAMVAMIVVLTILIALLMNWVGIRLLSFLYGLDFSAFSGLCMAMLIAGGITAATDFLYQTITILRCQHKVILVFCISAVLSVVIPLIGVKAGGLSGTVYSYLIVMFILFVMLLIVYVQIRQKMKQSAVENGIEEGRAGGTQN